MLTAILAILFWVALGATISSYVWQGKRWWGTRGYRVRIVRRNAWVGLGAVFVVLMLALSLRGKEPAKSAPAANKATEEAISPKQTSAAVASIPESAAPPASSEAANPNVGYYCGTERWPVKTLSDEDRDRVNLKPVPTTVAVLDALPRPALLPDHRRAEPVELTTYTRSAPCFLRSGMKRITTFTSSSPTLPTGAKP